MIAAGASCGKAEIRAGDSVESFGWLKRESWTRGTALNRRPGRGFAPSFLIRMRYLRHSSSHQVDAATHPGDSPALELLRCLASKSGGTFSTHWKAKGGPIADAMARGEQVKNYGVSVRPTRNPRLTPRMPVEPLTRVAARRFLG